MRGESLQNRTAFPGVVLSAIVCCVASLVLLTCTPPNFEPPPDIDPLTIRPIMPAVAAGAQISFEAAGGTPPYAYSIVSGSGSIVSGTGLYTAPDVPGSATVKVTDQNGETAETTVTIHPRTLVTSPSSVSIFMDSSFIITVSGGTPRVGTPPYTVSVDHGGTLEWIDGTSSWRFTATGTGDHTVSVTDESDPPMVAYCWIHVTTSPSELTISPATITLRIGETFTFSAGGGTPPYTFDKVSGSGSITPEGFYTAGPAGAAVVRVTDSAAPTPATDTAAITVNMPPLQITPTLINLPFDAGQDFNASGGQPPYSFSIVSGSSSGTIDPSTGVFTALRVAGTVVVRVTDSIASLPSEATVNVYAPLVISPKPASVEAGGTKTFTASGGVPGYSFAVVSAAGTGTIDADTGAYTAPPTPCSATIRVTDSIGNVDQTAVTVVDPAAWDPPIEVDTGGVGEFASLALTGAGDPCIAYKAGDILKFARWTGSSFVKVAADSSGDKPGQYASLALDSSNNPRISYYYSKLSKQGLGFAYSNGGLFTKSKIKSGNVGQYTSLALDPTESYHARIAYYDVANANLLYVESNGTSWGTPETVANAGDVGRYASLALTTSGSPRYPCIAYYDATNADLRYAWKDAGGWNYDAVVDSVGDVGQHASLALDSAGQPRIAYYDATNGDLKYAWKDAGIWNTETVDSAGDVGRFASLALDASGKPRIAYYDATAGKLDLKYASWTGSVWVIATVDASGDVGQYASLELDGAGKMRIAYYDAGGKLKYIAQQ